MTAARRESALSSLSRDFLWVLADDTSIVPVAGLAEDVRRKIAGRKTAEREGQFVIHRPLSRSSPKAVNETVRDVLLRFRRPSAFIQVVIDSAAAERVDPFVLLKRLEPVVRRFVASGLLVRADRSRDAGLRTIQPSLQAGVMYGDLRVITCISTTIDSEVYLVQTRDGRSRALKLSRPHFSTVATRLQTHEQLEREFKVLKRLTGTAACRLIDKGIRSGRVYGVIEWVEGSDAESRAEVLRKAAAGYPLARRRLADLVCGCLDALDSVHCRGVLHGDIHPRNFVVQDSTVRLVDFGLARELVPPNGGIRSSFSGVMQYMPPEAAVAARSGRHGFQKTVRSEIYSAAVLGYRLMTGASCLPASTSRSAGLLRIARSPMRSFAAVGAPPWPRVERVLRRAMSKQPSKRFASMSDFSGALASAASRPTAPALLPRAPSAARLDRAMSAVKDFASKYLDELRCLSYEDLIQTQNPPYASAAFGGAGISYALLRSSRHYRDPDLLSLAANWIGRSVDALGSPEALYAPDQDVTLKRVGRCSLYFSEMGVHLVQALVAHALDAEVMAGCADRELFRCFSGFSKAPARDMFLGRPGCLVAATALLSETNSAHIRRKGTAFMDAILNDAFVDEPPARRLVPWAKQENIGLAHGRAGMYFSLLQWSLISKTQLPAWIQDGLRELLRAGIPTKSGLDWPMRSAPHHPEFMDSLCNGTPGIAMTFARAYERYLDPDFLAGARAAAARVMRDEAEFANICCGAAGRAYSLLSVARIDPDGPWRSAALEFAARSLLRRRQAGSLHGLLKGQSGNLCLALDMMRTDGTAPSCPLLETL
jgi:serine/threonine-protein kinase